VLPPPGALSTQSEPVLTDAMRVAPFRYMPRIQNTVYIAKSENALLTMTRPSAT
jgi:hypothetical protein